MTGKGYAMLRHLIHATLAITLLFGAGVGQARGQDDGGDDGGDSSSTAPDAPSDPAPPAPAADVDASNIASADVLSGDPVGSVDPTLMQAYPPVDSSFSDPTAAASANPGFSDPKTTASVDPGFAVPTGPPVDVDPGFAVAGSPTTTDSGFSSSGPVPFSDPSSAAATPDANSFASFADSQPAAPASPNDVLTGDPLSPSLSAPPATSDGTLPALAQADQLPQLDGNMPAIAAVLAQPTDPSAAATTVADAPATGSPVTSATAQAEGLYPSQEGLIKQLTSESQLGQITDGTGTVQNGPFRNAQFYADQYGGQASDYVKMQSDGLNTTDMTGYGDQIKTHWVQNTDTGDVYDVKTKLFASDAPPLTSEQINANLANLTSQSAAADDAAAAARTAAAATSDAGYLSQAVNWTKSAAGVVGDGIASAASTAGSYLSPAASAVSDFVAPAVSAVGDMAAPVLRAAAPLAEAAAPYLAGAGEVVGAVAAPEVSVPLALLPTAIQGMNALNDYQFAHPIIMPNGDSVVPLADGSQVVNGVLKPALFPTMF